MQTDGLCVKYCSRRRAMRGSKSSSARAPASWSFVAMALGLPGSCSSRNSPDRVSIAATHPNG